jgi:RNA polymerase sigma factor (sigma-70 family)
MDGLQTQAEADVDDRELLARFVEGRDDRAFAGLVDRHGRMALGVCRRILGDSSEADDAFQAAFLVLIARAESLHRSPIGNRSLAGWLYRVAANAALQVRRKSSARRRHESAFARDREEMDVAKSPVRDVLPVLDEEIGRLPDRYRAPLVLCYYQGRSQHDAADELGISYATLRRRLDRARETLRSRLTRRGCSVALAGVVGLLTFSSAQAARIRPEEVDALAGPLTGHASGASTRAIAVSREILRMIRNQMIRRGAGFLVLALLLGSTGLVARDGRAADPGLAAPAPGFTPLVEAKVPAQVAAAIDPEPIRDPGPGDLDAPKKATDPDPVAALQATPPAAPPAAKGNAPATPEVDREILDALKGGSGGNNQATFKGSISINGQSREFHNAEDFRRAMQGMPGPGAAFPRLPAVPNPARREGPANPAPGPAAKAQPPENAAIDREIRNAIRKGQQQRRRRAPQLIGPGFNGMWGMWGMPGFGGVGGAGGGAGVVFGMPGMPGFRGAVGAGGFPGMPGFGGVGGAGGAGGWMHGMPGMPGFGGAGGAGGMPGFGGAGGAGGMPGFGGAGGMPGIGGQGGNGGAGGLGAGGGGLRGDGRLPSRDPKPGNPGPGGAPGGAAGENGGAGGAGGD